MLRERKTVGRLCVIMEMIMNQNTDDFINDDGFTEKPIILSSAEDY
jgi:hypothetical protein